MQDGHPHQRFLPPSPFVHRIWSIVLRGSLVGTHQQRGRREKRTPHLLPDDYTTFPHPFRCIVVVYSKSFEEELILSPRVRPLTPSRQHNNNHRFIEQHLHEASREPPESFGSPAAPTPRMRYYTDCLCGLSGMLTLVPLVTTREKATHCQPVSTRSSL